MDNFEKRRKAFLATVRGGEKSAINKKRNQEARNFHKKFREKMHNEIKQEENQNDNNREDIEK